MALRPYQEEAVFDVLRAEARGDKRVILQQPTGTGKTTVAAEVVKRKQRRRVLYIVPRQEIFDQTSRKLTANGLRHVQVKSGAFPDLRAANCVLAMSQTLAMRIKAGHFDGHQFDHVIIDEIHTLYEQHENIIDRFDCAVLGLTATPGRLDGQKLHSLCPGLISRYQYSWYVRSGWLSPVRTVEAYVPDLSKLTRRMGDYDAGQLNDAYSTTEAVDSLVDSWRSLARGRRTLCFTAGVPASKAYVHALKRAGIRAEHVDGNTAPGARKLALAKLDRHELDVLCNCGLFVEGLDVPSIDCVQEATSTMSLPRHLQKGGRGTRLSPSTGKRDLLMLVNGLGLRLHGPIDADRDWYNDGKVCAVTVYCPGCGQPQSAPIGTGGPRVCESCSQRAVMRAREAAPTMASQAPRNDEREQQRLSLRTPPRPVPAWAKSVANEWNDLERVRVLRGTPLGHTESKCRAYLAR